MCAILADKKKRHPQKKQLVTTGLRAVVVNIIYHNTISVINACWICKQETLAHA